MSFLKNPFFRFIIISTGIYLGWTVLYEFFLKPSTIFDDLIIDSLVKLGESGLQLIGYEVTPYQDFPYRIHIGVMGSKGVTIGAPCDGAVLFALFVAFIVAFPGKIQNKLWFVPVGLLSIHLINVLRVMGLAIIVHINEDWLAFNHDYTFTLFVYAWVFFLWWIWISRYSPLAGKNKNSSANP